ncbi:CapA family protein [Candidatus Saccharibacteria bacterium]|nr:MAG: CapA family protein [Candidatus Saccharibacteria bacterium]
MYRAGERPRRYRRQLLIAVGAVFVGTAGCAAAYRFTPQQPPPWNAPQLKSKAYVTTVSSNVLFTGNSYFSRYINDHAMKSELKYAYPFSRLSEFHREQYDEWVTGLECPTVAGLQQTSAQEDATLSFNCNPQYLPELVKWFGVVTLANNHTDNQGAAGFTETKMHLEENNIQYFGHPDPRELEDICEVISLPATVATSDKKTTKGFLPVAMCGYHGFIRLPLPDSIAVMKKYSTYMPVIAMPHAGTEYRSSPERVKVDLYRSMIDNGADMVLGDHPHVVQPSEAYKGHPIFYSMGNFIFDQQVAPEMTRSAAINVKFTVNGADAAQLNKWLAVGKMCNAYHDDCLARIQQAGLQKLPYNFMFDIIGSDDLGYITKPASSEVQAGILQRLNWEQVKTQLQPPYFANSK